MQVRSCYINISWIVQVILISVITCVGQKVGSSLSRGLVDRIRHLVTISNPDKFGEMTALFKEPPGKPFDNAEIE